MTTREELNADFDRLSKAVLKVKAERDAAVAALRALYDAVPTGYGGDRALNEAQIRAEKVLEACDA